MFQQAVLCPGIRTYLTKWSIEDCVMFLGRKNVYDVFEYEFKNIQGAYYIVFGNPKGFRTLHMRFCNGAVYSIQFKDWKEWTKFIVKYDHVEDNAYGIDAPCIDSPGLDQFFCRKLDAKRFYPDL